MTTAIEKVQGIVEMYLRKLNERSRVALTLSGDNPVSVYSTVNNGRGPRDEKGRVVGALPIIGSREVSRLGDDLDRERAEMTVVFTVSGIINGVPYDDVTIWINGDQVSLPTLFSGTKNASAILYELGRAVRDSVVRMPKLQDQAWQTHLDGVIARVAELRAYLDAVTAAAKGMQTAEV